MFMYLYRIGKGPAVDGCVCARFCVDALLAFCVLCSANVQHINLSLSMTHQVPLSSTVRVHTVIWFVGSFAVRPILCCTGNSGKQMCCSKADTSIHSTTHLQQIMQPCNTRIIHCSCAWSSNACNTHLKSNFWSTLADLATDTSTSDGFAFGLGSASLLAERCMSCAACACCSVFINAKSSPEASLSAS